MSKKVNKLICKIPFTIYHEYHPFEILEGDVLEIVSVFNQVAVRKGDNYVIDPYINCVIHNPKSEPNNGTLDFKLDIPTASFCCDHYYDKQDEDLDA